MLAYVLQKPEGLPATVWACKTTVDDYAWENHNGADMIEIGICTAAERTFLYEGTPMTIRGTTLDCIVGDTPLSGSAAQGMPVEITSIAVRFPSLRAELRELSEEDLGNREVLLLPLFYDALSERELSELSRLFHQYIQSSLEESVAGEFLCSSILFELLSRLDRLARRRAVQVRKKYSNYYVRRAEYLVESRFAERLTLASVAAELGITPAYFSALYKESTGVCFSERLSEVRLKKAEELLISSSLSVSAIAERVGLGDESNLRKRFKQYFGMNLREYRCAAREQTLYHEKPLRKKE